ncbi:43082_t:CDS:2 [Gigaspora margarita]|uniref:43082_t:CDS:1 n=1 Tax=Gigaspora margarita TaxID=4874 RepID=A0ABN7VL52_GIGMA|nr:43082_t:CDS:2 [Gigaspora margarita]
MSAPQAEIKHNEGKGQEAEIFKFTRDWLKPHLHYRKRPCLELSKEDTTWILEKLCKDPESKLNTIDIFVKIFPDNDNEATFHENISKTHKEKQIEVIKIKSFDALINLNHDKKMSFDFIYIDGSHESHDVSSDAILSWNLLKEGGIMIFDDYEWDFFEEYLNPRIAIDSFLKCYQAKLN